MLFNGMAISQMNRLAWIEIVSGILLLLISQQSIGEMTELNAGFANLLLIIIKYFTVRCCLLNSSGIPSVIT